MSEHLVTYGYRARIGMLLPSGNIAAEPQIAVMLPEGVSLHTTRMKLVGSSDTQLLQMIDRLEADASLLADAKVQIILFNCTAVSTWSPDKETEILSRIEESVGIPAIATSQALIAALERLTARRVVLVTPYLEEVTQREISFLRQRGVDVVDAASLDLNAPDEMFAVAPEQWVEFTSRHAHPEADAYVISCTAIRSAEVISQLENQLERPVLTSNQAIVWRALEHLGIPAQTSSFGRLFDSAKVV